MNLQTERLTIRDFVLEDWKEVHSYASNPLVAKYMIWGPNTEEETRAFIKRAIDMQMQSPRVGYEFAVTLSSNDELIGGVGIHVVSEGVAEMSTCLPKVNGMIRISIRF